MPADGYPPRRSEGLVRPALGCLAIGVGTFLAAGAMVYAWLRDVHGGWRVYRELHRDTSHTLTRRHPPRLPDSQHMHIYAEMGDLTRTWRACRCGDIVDRRALSFPYFKPRSNGGRLRP